MTFFHLLFVIEREKTHMSVIFICMCVVVFGHEINAITMNYSITNLWNSYPIPDHEFIELEFAPHGRYLVILLTARRQTFKQLLPLPDYTVEHPSSDRWIGRVHIPRSLFPSHIDRFNAYGIHGQGDNRTYEALYPAPRDSKQPDFHRLELFQPINFDSLLYVGDKDGDSWNE